MANAQLKKLDKRKRGSKAPLVYPMERRASEAIGILHVWVIEARGIATVDRGGTSDAFVKMYYDTIATEKHKWASRVHKKTTDPFWHEQMKTMVLGKGESLLVELWDWNRGKDEFLGSVEPIVVDDSLQASDSWYPLGPQQLRAKSRKGLRASCAS